MYIDASALVAILANEPERAEFLRAIAASETTTTSAVSVFETSLAISSLTGSCSSALSEVMRLIEAARIQILAIDAGLLPELCIARDRYGKGSGHPARLNMGDCFSYAIARQAGVALLYKGDDFSQTDLG